LYKYLLLYYSRLFKLLVAEVGGKKYDVGSSLIFSQLQKIQESGISDYSYFLLPISHFGSSKHQQQFLVKCL